MGTKDSLVGRLLGNAEKFTDKQVAETLTMLVTHGASRGASDIHIEPHERFVLVRYRIDGALRGVHKLPRPALGSVIAQLKALAKLNGSETRTPQEGDYTQSIGEKTVDVHLTTMPVYGGEKAVLHLSMERDKPQELSQLGLWGPELMALKAVLARPHGLVIVAGPRHSGLSSTLFSLLQAVNSPMASLATVETSTTYRLPGANQTHLGAGMSVLQGLQAALKQDPNIIMVDTIADSATAELAVHTATTGHLVLTGIRADSSIAAVLRLHHAGVEPFLLTTALRASIGQRLVRQLCPHCRERYALSPEERSQLEQSFGMATTTARKRVHELERLAAPTIFGDFKQVNSTPAGITHLWRASEHGCEHCHHSGYLGQTVIIEMLQNSDALHKALLSREPLSAGAIQAAMVKEGFIPMALDGLIKALRGQTTAAEVLRAVSA